MRTIVPYIFERRNAMPNAIELGMTDEQARAAFALFRAKLIDLCAEYDALQLYEDLGDYVSAFHTLATFAPITDRD